MEAIRLLRRLREHQAWPNARLLDAWRASGAYAPVGLARAESRATGDVTALQTDSDGNSSELSLGAKVKQ